MHLALRHGRGALVAGVAVLGVVGCGGGSRAAHGGGGMFHQTGAVDTHGHPVPVVTPGVPKGEQTVHLLVVTSSSDHETMALVPVYVDGKGPFPFAVDTGASQSVIDRKLVSRLHLASQGDAGTLHGVTGSARGIAVVLSSWRAGTVALPSERLASVDLGNHGPVGLLGSDVMSRYGKVAIDYSRDLLLLDPPVK